jgi:hypothetical protein
VALTIFFSAFAAVCVVQTARTFYAWRYLRAARCPNSPEDGPRMYLFVPVAFEQSIIAVTFECFSALLAGRPWLHVVFITTARETGRGDETTTHDILEDLLRKSGNARVRILYDRRLFGVMAHQINYAVEQILAEAQVPFLIGIYNADSNTPPAAIDYARGRLMHAPSSVLQQYAAYRLPADGTVADRIRSHVAAWQTRWSLQFELGRLLIDHSLFPEPRGSGDALNLARPLHYAIGHGLFLSSTTWQLVGGLPEESINEDAFFGLLLHIHGKRLEPIPYLEIADPPPTLSSYIKQQAVWFNGPLYAFFYASNLYCGSRDLNADRTPIYGWIARINVGVAAIKLSLHAVYWLVGPIMLMLVTFLVLARGEWYVVAAWALLVVYFVYGLNVIAQALARQLGVTTGHVGGPIVALAAYILHGVGPLICIARVLSGKNKQEHKYKTERDPATRL